mgnify:CR=1 FL=1
MGQAHVIDSAKPFAFKSTTSKGKGPAFGPDTGIASPSGSGTSTFLNQVVECCTHETHMAILSRSGEVYMKWTLLSLCVILLSHVSSLTYTPDHTHATYVNHQSYIIQVRQK